MASVTVQNVEKTKPIGCRSSRRWKSVLRASASGRSNTPSEMLVHAELRPEKAEEMKVLWTEFGPNNIYRQFEMPEPIDVEKIRARLDKGMLHITAAKAPAAKVMPVAVAAA